MVAFADDLSKARRLSKLRSEWKDLLDVGPKNQYLPKPGETMKIVKLEYESEAEEKLFDNTNIKIKSSVQ